ncbi:2TM domain-containing protein [Winogradskyella ouciana]|uniref:2TM domain-containing protein n=1 Tax=Winogradskyella ouciana TaxID=2608631 RepID=UPI003D2A5E5A
MEIPEDKEQRILQAKKKVRLLKLFYIHLAAYIVFVALLSYNLYIVEGSYKNNIISLNLSIIVAWTVFIVIHGFKVFKDWTLFNKNWEDKKLRKFAPKEETEKKMWE